MTISGYASNSKTIAVGASGSANVMKEGSVSIIEYASTEGSNDCKHVIATTAVTISQSGPSGDHLATIVASQSALNESASTPYIAKFLLNSGAGQTLSSSDYYAGRQHNYDSLDYSKQNTLDITISGTGTVAKPVPPYPATGIVHITNNTGCPLLTTFGNGYVPADGQEYTFTNVSSTASITEAGDLGYIDSNSNLFVKTTDCATLTTANLVINPGNGIQVNQLQYQNYAVTSYASQGLAPHSYLNLEPSAYGNSFVTPNTDSPKVLFSDR